MSISVENLSGSTNGKPVVVVGTASGSETTIHTQSGTGYDHIKALYATNIDSSDVELTLAIGSTAVDGEIVANAVVISPNETKKIILVNEKISSGVTIKAWGSVASKINLTGEILRVV